MLKTVSLILAVSLSALILNSCDNDDDSVENNSGFTDDAVAFIESLNEDVDFNLRLVLAETNENGFLVAYDPLTKSFDAIIISDWNPNTSASDYYYANSARFFFDLFKLSDSKYTDRSSDLVFESPNSPVNIIETDLAPEKINGITLDSVITKSSPAVSDEIGDLTKYIFRNETEIEIKFNETTETGTYNYSKINSEQSIVVETTQDGTSTIELTFTSYASGTFREEFREGDNDNGALEFFEGTFTISP